MFINMITVWMVQMAIMQIVDVTIMTNSGVTTVFTMLVIMIFVVGEITVSHIKAP
jgi:hypothetical protein